MLTIKVIDSARREYILCDVDEVHFVPGKDNGPSDSVIVSFKGEAGNQEYRGEDYSVIFVMNENGKTVARYDL